MRRRSLAASLLAVCSVLATAGVAWADQPPDPFHQSPGISPPGANDFSCKPPARHPHPVVLVHGTFADMTISWNLISPALKQQGYCVFALDYGQRATQRIQDSATELSRFVARVRRATGAAKVSIVGHSQGGMMPRYYLKFLSGAGKVSDLIGLAPSNHGTTTPLARPAGQYGSCPACTQQIAGSAFLRRLNAGDETPGRVSYTQIETSHDEVVTPFRSAFLEPGPRTTNVLLQDACPLDLSEHVGIIYDPAALQWIENALGRSGPASPSFNPVCA
jgi:triacylglycerol lipase